MRRVKIAAAMLREHRWTYCGLALVIVVASMLITASLCLSATGRSPDIDLTTLTANEQIRMTIDLATAEIAPLFITAISAFAGIFLVAQTMSFVVDSRRQELAQLRLLGSSRRQVTSMILMESAVLALFSAPLGAVLAIPTLTPYTELLASQNNWPAILAPRFHIGAAVIGILLVVGVAVTGAFVSARRIAKTAPIEAVQTVPSTRKLMPFSRWIFFAAGIAAVIWFFSLHPSRGSDWVMLPAAVGGGGILCAIALAPLIVPAVARVVGAVVALIAPGAGLVAREHVSHAARRTTAMATPVLLAIGVGGVGGMAILTMVAEEKAKSDRVSNASVVVEKALTGESEGAFEAVTGLDEVSEVTRIQESDEWSWAGADRGRDYFPQLVGIDPVTLPNFLQPHVVVGNLADVRGNNVAVLDDPQLLGQNFEIQSPAGDRVTVRVAAVVEMTPLLFGTFIVDQSAFDLSVSDGSKTVLGEPSETWFVQGASDVDTGQTVKVVADVVPEARVSDLASWAKERSDAEIRRVQSAVGTFFGGAAVLAIVSLTQSAFTGTRERGTELGLLRRVGARRRSVIGTVVTEFLVVVTAAALLSLGVIALMYERMSSAIADMGMQVTPVVPIVPLVAVVLVCLVLGAVASGTAAAGVVKKG